MHGLLNTDCRCAQIYEIREPPKEDKAPVARKHLPRYTIKAKQGLYTNPGAFTYHR